MCRYCQRTSETHADPSPQRSARDSRAGHQWVGHQRRDRPIRPIRPTNRAPRTLAGCAHGQVERLALATEQPAQLRGRDGQGGQPDRGREDRPLGAGPLPGGHHPLFRQFDGPGRSQLPRALADHAHGQGVGPLHVGDGGFVERGRPFARAGAGPSLSRPGVDVGDHPVRQLLPLLHPQPHCGRPVRPVQPHGL